MKQSNQSIQNAGANVSKLIWTLLAVCLHLITASASPGWIALLIILNLALSITLIWRDKNG
jgi:hypothetical protein